MKWTQDIPTKAGLYMRNNPPCSHVVRHYLFRLDPRGRLRVSTEGGAIDLHKWAKRGKFWWYGPIPPPPRRPK